MRNDCNFEAQLKERYNSSSVSRRRRTRIHWDTWKTTWKAVSKDVVRQLNSNDAKASSASDETAARHRFSSSTYTRTRTHDPNSSSNPRRKTAVTSNSQRKGLKQRLLRSLILSYSSQCVVNQKICTRDKKGRRQEERKVQVSLLRLCLRIRSQSRDSALLLARSADSGFPFFFFHQDRAISSWQASPRRGLRVSDSGERRDNQSVMR